MSVQIIQDEFRDERIDLLAFSHQKRKGAEPRTGHFSSSPLFEMSVLTTNSCLMKVFVFHTGE